MLHRALAAITASTLAALASAQGLYLGPDAERPPAPPRLIQPSPAHPSIRVTSLKVNASIIDGIATTRLHQVFHNQTGQIAEGTWILPLPTGATADGFTMTVNGKEMPAEVLAAGKARSIYEEIVRRQRDPGLLEYMGTGCLRARIFPIPANGEIEVKVRYRQVLPETAGLHHWTYPLRAAGAGGQGPEKLSLDLSIHSRTPLKSVYSPLAGADISKRGDHDARVSLELDRGQLPERDLSVFYGVTEVEFGLHLLTYRKSGDPGYFMMLLAPKQDWPEPENTVKVLSFVLDTSGSMQGKKIEQARAALRFFVQSLGSRDLFNVIPFSTEARPFFPSPVPTAPENLERALAKIGEIEARGGTNIEDAMRVALSPAIPSEPASTTYIPITVFLTDGRPTVGMTDVNQLLASVKQANSNHSRVFVFGVGDDVNSRLLDKIAADHRGDRDYVREHESIEVKTSALFTKLSHPVMTGVEIACDDVEGFDLFPRRTPELFKGSRLLTVGRYRSDGHHSILLKGIVNGKEREYVFEGAFPGEATEHDFLPVLWAERKVGFLLDQIRLNGQKQELVEEVRKLGVEFGIVTPFTSHLILEEGMRVSRSRGLQPESGGQFGSDDELRRVRRDLARAGGLASPAAGSIEEPALGLALKKASADADRSRTRLGRLREQERGGEAVDNSVMLHGFTASAAPSAQRYHAGGNAAQLMHRRIKDRSFYLAGGVWVDSQHASTATKRARKIRAFSPDYFTILSEHPQLAPFFAFSTRIVVVLGDLAVEVH